MSVASSLRVRVARKLPLQGRDPEASPQLLCTASVEPLALVVAKAAAAHMPTFSSGWIASCWGTQPQLAALLATQAWQSQHRFAGAAV